MRELDLVSVIIPVYNVEQFLDRCVNSVVNQTYTNLEIILVDDGATDSSSELCDRWAEKDSRITVVHKVNGGLSSARNAGIACSHAPWIAFIDSDDWVDPEYISTLHELAVSNHADLAICSIYDYHTPHHLLDPLPDEILTGRDLFVEIAKNDNWHYQVAWNKLYARGICPPDLFPVGKLHEDILTFPNVALSARTVAISSKPLYHYMVNPGSIMHTKYGIRNLDAIEAMVKRLNIAIDQNLADCYTPIATSIRGYYLREAAIHLPFITDVAARRRLLQLVDDYLKAIDRVAPLNDSGLNHFNMKLSRHPLRMLMLIRVLSLRQRICNKIRGIVNR